MPAVPAHHVGVTVADLDATLPFYRDVLGLSVLAEFSVTGEGFSQGVGVPEATGTFVHLDGHGVRIELVEYDPAGPSQPAPTVNEPGAVHLGFSVDDIEAFHARLPPEVETISDPQTTESGARICFLRDPEDNLIEVLEPSS